MEANVGSVDRGVRVVIIGLALLSLLFVLHGDARWWGLIGVVPLATAAFRFCPLYRLVGPSTCPLRRRDRLFTRPAWKPGPRVAGGQGLSRAVATQLV